MNRPGAERTLFWAMAIACFTAALACLAARAVDRAAIDVLRDRSGYLIVRVLAPEGDDGLNRAATALIGDPGIAAAEVMSPERAANLIEAWTGGAPPTGELPPLRLIEVTLAPDAPADASAARDLVRTLSDAGVTAEAIGPPDDPRADQAARLRQAALWGAGGLTGVMALIVALAARAFAGRRRDFVTVMADLGAERGDVSLRLSDEAGGVGFLAGLIGAGAAGAAGAALLSVVEPNGAWLAGLAPADVAPLIAAPLLAALAAGAGAHFAANALFARAARLG